MKYRKYYCRRPIYSANLSWRAAKFRCCATHEGTQMSRHDPARKCWQGGRHPWNNAIKGPISGKASWRRKHLSWVLKKEEDRAEWRGKKGFSTQRKNIGTIWNRKDECYCLANTPQYVHQCVPNNWEKPKITCWWDLSVSWTNGMVASQVLHFREITSIPPWRRGS